MGRRGSGFRSTIDLDGPREAIVEGATKGLILACEALLTEANKRAPLDEGTLERSGFTDVDESDEGYLRGAISYDTPYAVKQHEDMELNHPGKGEPKWLETTISENSDKTAQTIATAIRSELGA